MQSVIADILKTSIPTIVGALIVIVPTMIEKFSDIKFDRIKQQRDKKQEMYVEIISLFSRVLKEGRSNTDVDQLRERINLISITGSVEVVKALNDYLDTWGKNTGVEDQKYCDLLKAMRVDLQVDSRLNTNFPEIGLRDINVKKDENDLKENGEQAT